MIVAIKITSACNLACKYCYEKNYQDKTESTSIKHFDYINMCLKQSSAKLTVCVQGGEPTLHENLLEFLEKLKNNEKVQKIIVVTNGKKLVQLPDYVDVVLSYHVEEMSLTNFLLAAKHYKPAQIEVPLYCVEKNKMHFDGIKEAISGVKINFRKVYSGTEFLEKYTPETTQRYNVLDYVTNIECEPCSFEVLPDLTVRYLCTSVDNLLRNPLYFKNIKTTKRLCNKECLTNFLFENRIIH